MKNKQIELRFGAFAPPLFDQLSAYNLSLGIIKQYQRYADAIVRLSAQNIITAGEARKARKRLTKQIAAAIRCDQKEGASSFGAIRPTKTGVGAIRRAREKEGSNASE